MQHCVCCDIAGEYYKERLLQEQLEEQWNKLDRREADILAARAKATEEYERTRSQEDKKLDEECEQSLNEME